MKLENFRKFGESIGIFVLLLVLISLFTLITKDFIHGIQFLNSDFSIFYFSLTISFLNIILLVYLLANYLELYRKFKSEFSIGLIALVISLLVYSITSNPLLNSLLLVKRNGFGMGGPMLGMGFFSIIPSLFTLTAVIILLYLSQK